MPFHLDLLSMFPMLPVPRGNGGGGDSFGGFGPGFDLGDVLDFIGGISNISPLLNIGAGGVIEATPGHVHTEGEMFDPTDPATWHALPEQAGGGLPATGGNGGNGRGGTTVRRGLYIGGSCPGLWHTTPVRTVFDRKTGAARQVGGNRSANRITLVQDDSGDLQFFAPVEPTGWRFKHKKRARHHHHPRRHHHHPRRHKRVTHGHRHHLTRKQLAAGFGGKAHMRAH